MAPETVRSTDHLEKRIDRLEGKIDEHFKAVSGELREFVRHQERLAQVDSRLAEIHSGCLAKSAKLSDEVAGLRLRVELVEKEMESWKQFKRVGVWLLSGGLITLAAMVQGVVNLLK